jgi:hypothetical protein
MLQSSASTYTPESDRRPPREHEFTEWRTATVWCGTYNVNAKMIGDDEIRALETWLFAENEKLADVVAIVSRGCVGLRCVVRQGGTRGRGAEGLEGHGGRNGGCARAGPCDAMCWAALGLREGRGCGRGGRGREGGARRGGAIVGRKHTQHASRLC